MRERQGDIRVSRLQRDVRTFDNASPPLETGACTRSKSTTEGNKGVQKAGNPKETRPAVLTLSAVRLARSILPFGLFTLARNRSASRDVNNRQVRRVTRLAEHACFSTRASRCE